MLISPAEKIDTKAQKTRHTYQKLGKLIGAVIALTTVAFYVFGHFAVDIVNGIGRVKIDLGHGPVIHLTCFEHNHTDVKLVSCIDLFVYYKTVHLRKLTQNTDIGRNDKRKMAYPLTLFTLGVKIVLHRLQRYIDLDKIQGIVTLWHYMRS